MFHPRAHWLKNTVAVNEHVAAYTRLYLHLKAQRSVLESIQTQFTIKLNIIRQKNEEFLLKFNEKNEENHKKDEKIESDETIFVNCISSIDTMLKSDIKTAIFEASNFIMKTKDFPLTKCSPETVKLVNVFTTSCVSLIKFPSTLLANFCEMNKKNNSNQNSPKNIINNKKEKTILDSPIKAYIENTSSSDEYDYSSEYIDYSTYSTLSVESSEINNSNINSSDQNYNDANNADNDNEIKLDKNSSNNENSDIKSKNEKSDHASDNKSENTSNNENQNDIVTNPKKRSKRHKKHSARGPPSTVVCRLCNEPIPIDLFEEHIKSCAIAFKSELKVQDVNQMLLQEYDAIGTEFISAPWPGERQKAVSVTLPMLHLSILLMRSHDIEENTNDSLEELENIEHSILHIPFVLDFDDEKKNDQKKKGNALYRNVSNYYNEKMKPSKNKYKKISLKTVGSGLLNHFSKRKARNTPIKKSDLKSTDESFSTENTTSDADNHNSIENTSNSNESSDISTSSSKRSSLDLTIENPVLKYVNESLKLLREKINLTVVLCAASDILRNTRLSGSDKITTIKSVRITNFEFIKLISAGAYARVFLAQMKSTGDVCAVKVTPKASCTHKNEVLQLITEKNIMLKFNNPYIVTFCMYILQKYLFFLSFLLCVIFILILKNKSKKEEKKKIFFFLKIN